MKQSMIIKVLVALMVLVFSSVSMAQEQPKRAVVIEDAGLAQKLNEMGSNAVCEACTRDRETCMKALEVTKGDFETAKRDTDTIMQECRHPCKTYEEWKVNEGKCVPKGGGAGKSKKAYAPPPVKFVSACPEDPVLDETLGKSPGGDAVSVKRTDALGNECVPTFAATQRSIEHLRIVDKAMCRADDVKMSENEIAVLAQIMPDYKPEDHLGPDDPRCDKSGRHLVYLLAYIAKLEKDKKTPVIAPPELVRETEEAKTDLKEVRDALKNAFAADGVHFQLLGTGFVNLRPQEGRQNSYGFQLRPYLILKDGNRDGVAFGAGLGYGQQSHKSHSEMAMWRASVGWFHLFNDPGESTLYAMRLGGFVGGGALQKNVQDEMQGGPEFAFQFIFGKFVTELGIQTGFGQLGLYNDAGDRIGHGKTAWELGFFLSLGYMSRHHY